MANQTSPLNASPPSDTDSSTSSPPVPGVSRQDTASSTGSAKPLPQGNWKINISGNCPACHHHHQSVKVRVTAPSDVSHSGNVDCEKCGRKWVAFGKRSSTRISLLSTTTIEPEPSEMTAFRASLVQLLRDATTIAISSTLTDIPEGTSPGPSRKASIRSNARSGIHETIPTTYDPVPTAKDVHASSVPQARDTESMVRPSMDTTTKSQKRPAAKVPKLLRRVTKKLGEKLPMLQNSPLRRWLSDSSKMSAKQKGKLPAQAQSTHGDPPVVIISNVQDASTGMENDLPIERKQDELDVCGPSTSAKEAQASLATLDKEAIRALTPEQRVAWLREQVTAFKTRYTKPVSPTAVTPVTSPAMVDTSVQVDQPDIIPVLIPPTRRHSALAFVGNSFGTFEYWQIFRGSNSTLNARPLSMSETHPSDAGTTHLSDAETAVESSSAPRHTQLENLQRERARSSSPYTRSIQSIVQNWQQSRQSRVELRQSFDSSATAGVWSITPTRGRGANRLSRQSIGLASTVYNTELSMSQVQLPPAPDEGSGLPNNQQRGSPPPPSPPTS